MIEHNELFFLPAYKLKELMISKQISPVELTKLFLDRIQQFNPLLHAFLHITADTAIEAAKNAEALLMRGGGLSLPLFGVPITVMDNIHMKGVPTTYGSLLFKDAIPAEDSLLVARLKAAGAVILGKTNMSEFGLYPSTENRLSPPSCNPWNPAYSAGGGSGGAASAVAAGLTPLAIAADINGGIRLPGSFCGVFGLKPTRGKIPFVHGSAVPPAERMLFHEGIITRSPKDTALALHVLAQVDAHDHESYFAKIATEWVKHDSLRKLRIGFSLDFGFIKVAPEVLTIFNQAKKHLLDAGHTVQEITLNLDQGILSQYCDVVSVDKYLGVLPVLSSQPESFTLFTDYMQWWMKRAKQVTGLHYSAAFMTFGWVADMIDNALKDCDILITPTVPVPPFLQSQFPQAIEGQRIDPHVGLCAFTIPCNMSGHPALSIPCGMTKSGLPIGLQAIGKSYDDELLLQFGSICEALFSTSSLLAK